MAMSLPDRRPGNRFPGRLSHPALQLLSRIDLYYFAPSCLLRHVHRDFANIVMDLIVIVYIMIAIIVIDGRYPRQLIQCADVQLHGLQLIPGRIAHQLGLDIVQFGLKFRRIADGRHESLQWFMIRRIDYEET
jgi:hypothetical protein